MNGWVGLISLFSYENTKTFPKMQSELVAELGPERSFLI